VRLSSMDHHRGVSGNGIPENRTVSMLATYPGAMVHGLRGVRNPPRHNLRDVTGRPARTFALRAQEHAGQFRAAP
jgi:hypothetical protein